MKLLSGVRLLRRLRGMEQDEIVAVLVTVLRQIDSTRRIALEIAAVAAPDIAAAIRAAVAAPAATLRSSGAELELLEALDAIDAIDRALAAVAAAAPPDIADRLREIIVVDRDDSWMSAVIRRIDEGE